MAFISFKLVKHYLDSECVHGRGGKVIFFFKTSDFSLSGSNHVFVVDCRAVFCFTVH